LTEETTMGSPRGGLFALVGLVMVLGGCGERGVDWNAPENLVLREQSKKRDDGVLLEYWSLVDAPAKSVYDALTDIEHWPEFIPGVDNVSLIAVGTNTKTVQIGQHVIGRQANAKVEWKYLPDQLRIEFKTLSSNLNYNDGTYEIQPSPDGKRCLVHSSFLVREGQGAIQSVPIGVLVSGTRDAFLAAAKGVRDRAAGTKKPATASG
jgi:ribosome-associated toxin RatA of RatAB toxin-antitoxin module